MTAAFARLRRRSWLSSVRLLIKVVEREGGGRREEGEGKREGRGREREGRGRGRGE